MIAEFDFEKREITRDIIWNVSSDRELMEEPRGKIPRRAETSESVCSFSFLRSKLVQTPTDEHEPLQVITHPESDSISAMTEEGPSGEYKMTMQRDRHGRGMPTKGERTMNIQKAREERRNFYVGGSQEHGTFSIASAEASTLHGKFYLSRMETLFLAEEETQFSKAIETKWQGVLDFKAETIIDSTQADVIREKHCERVISSRLLRWKETDTGYKAKARWCVHGFYVPEHYTADPGVDYVRRDVGRRGDGIHAR